VYHQGTLREGQGGSSPRANQGGPGGQSPREKTVSGRAFRAIGVLALAGAGLIGLADAAVAATNTGVSGGGSYGGGMAAGMPADYSCGLAGYGQGLAPLSVPAALSATGTGTKVRVRLATQPVQLPTAAASALSKLHWLDVSGVAQAGGMAGSSVMLGGHSGYLGGAAGMTRLPAMTASGTATQMGTPGTVTMPRTLTLTPVDMAHNTPLTCTTTSSVTVRVTAVSDPATGAATSASGQSYACTVTAGTSTTTVRQVRATLSATGSATVGVPDTVALSAPASALGAGFPDSATPMSESGTAGLGGASQGSVPMTGLADAGNGKLTLTGRFTPETAGMVRISAPHSFAARLQQRTTTATTVLVTCTKATATTTTTQVMVQAAASPAAADASARASAAAPGAPNTGGGGSLHPASDLLLAAGGAAAACAGLGIALYALRRRRGLSG
jgi:hypothetical protein